MTKAVVYRIQKRLPSALRNAVARTPLGRAAARRVDPFHDPGYIWTLTGPLEGARFRVAEPSERQYITGPYEPAVVEAVSSAVKAGMTCVDAGAHIGYMTLIMARAAGADRSCRGLRADRVQLRATAREPRAQLGRECDRRSGFVSVGEGQVHLADGPSSFEHHLDCHRQRGRYGSVGRA